MNLITNILKRVKEADFVRYVGGKFIDKDDKEIAVSGGLGGAGTQDEINNATAKTMLVDADRFGITDSAELGVLKSLDWLNFKEVIVAYLKSLDFVRVNSAKELISGSDAIVTQASAGIRLGFDLATSDSDPTSGLFRANLALPATPGATIIFMIDYLDKNGVDMSSFMGAWAASGTLSIRSASSASSAFAVASIVAVADQDPSTYFKVTAKYLSGTSIPGGESCVVQYIPPTSVSDAITSAAAKTTPVDSDKFGLVDSAASNVLKYFTWSSLKVAVDAYLKTLGYARLDGNGNMLDGNNNIVDGVNPVYALASVPVSGITELPAANAMTNGSVIALHKNCLVGAGSNPLGVLLRPDTLNNVFRFACDRALLFSKRFGTLAAPTLTMTNTTQATSSKFNIGADIKIPGGLLYSGARLMINMHFRRNVSLVGLGTVTVRGYLGTDASVQTNNSIFHDVAITDVDNRDVSPSPEISFLSATTAISTGNISRGEAGLTTAFRDMSTLINVASEMTLSWGVVTTLDANNTIDFLGYEVWVVSQ